MAVVVMFNRLNLEASHSLHLNIANELTSKDSTNNTKDDDREDHPPPRKNWGITSSILLIFVRLLARLQRLT